ncbi:tyrosine-protein phosphatase [Niveispirillum fermenti]|uniref:tyrosine-protein phosphatase n=1 Tax=Niveispirillum fermenti TaxID=1233113 RepID=UPI003A85BC8B
MSNRDIKKIIGAVNFRDIGGIICNGSSVVGFGKIFRSDRLSLLNEDDLSILDGLCLRAIFDLRSRREREADPTCWTGVGVETHVFRPGHKRRLVDMAADYPATMVGAQTLMLDFYAELPRTMGHVFGEILRRIADGAFPCIIHCSAGKDRTGMAVALLLSALDCDRSAILIDYAASSHARRLEGAMVRSMARDPSVARFREQYPADALAVMTEARPEYLVAALDAIDREYGSMNAYLAGIGIDEPLIARLRAQLLEPMEKGRE